MGTLYAANLAQEGDEVLRRDGILFRHFQRRRPLASRLLIHLREDRADQYQWQGGPWRNGELGFASKLALGVLTHPVLLPPVQRRIGALQDRVLILPAKTGLIRRRTTRLFEHPPQDAHNFVGGKRALSARLRWLAHVQGKRTSGVGGLTCGGVGRDPALRRLDAF